MEKIKLTKVEAAPYKCSATYEWNCHIIQKDCAPFSSSEWCWHCNTLFGDRTFRTLRGLKHAIQLHVEGKLNSINIEDCEEE